MSPPVPSSEVTEATSRCSADDLAQVLLEPWRVLEVAGDRDPWIWCIANTIALAPQRRPSSKQAAAIASKETPPPPSSVGTKAESARSALSASTVSDGKRASPSTASAFWPPRPGQSDGPSR